MDDVLIIGGGVIGLSLAYELSHHGVQAHVLERGLPGGEASWAGAGILPPRTRRPDDHPLEQLAGLSHQLHAEWAARLQAETAIDNGFRRCGGIYVARGETAVQHLRRAAEDWSARQIKAEPVTPAELSSLEPALDVASIEAAYLLPDECQLRNPRHIQALHAACLLRRVEVETDVAAERLRVAAGRVTGVETSAGWRPASAVCIAGGAWSRLLLEPLGIQPAVLPVRGQIVLVASDPPLLTRVINEGSRYLVPRDDGRLLIGSTEEEAGFDRRTTASGIAGLIEFGISLTPAVANLPVERCWAGLRPGTRDGLPYLGPVPGVAGLFIAAGHFRQGLHLSPGTAVVMSQLIRGHQPEIDLTPFRLDRTPDSQPGCRQ
jgi:glycine oxidase